MDIIAAILIFLLSQIVLSILRKNEQPDGTEEIAKSDSEVIPIVLEEIKGQYYAWYEEPKDKFIVQAKSIDALINELNVIFNGKNIRISTSEEIKCHLEKSITN